MVDFFENTPVPGVHVMIHFLHNTLISVSFQAFAVVKKVLNKPEGI